MTVREKSGPLNERAIPSKKRQMLYWNWPIIFFAYALSLGLGTYWLYRDLTPHTWTIPPERQLVIADGHFSSYKPGVKAPYVFATEAGDRVELGCNPENTFAVCFQQYGIDLGELAREKAQIGYFYAYNSFAPNLSNVLMTLRANGKQILSYSDGREKLAKWAATEEHVKHLFQTLFLDVFGPFVLFLFATIQAVRLKIKQTEEGDDGTLR